MDKKHVVFDMDGTLVDSMGYWLNVVNEYFEKNNLNKTYNTAQIFKDYVVAMSITELIEYLNREHNINIEKQVLIDGLNEIMKRHYEKDVRLKKNVIKYLNELKNRNVKMCVASSTKEDLIELCLERLGIRKYFDFVLSSVTVGKGKSNPLIYNIAREKFNVESMDIAVYEDSLVALRTAKSANFYTIAVYDEHIKHNFDEFKNEFDEAIYEF